MPLSVRVAGFLTPDLETTRKRAKTELWPFYCHVVVCFRLSFPKGKNNIIHLQMALHILEHCMSMSGC